MNRLAPTASAAADAGSRAVLTYGQLGRLAVASLARTVLASVLVLALWAAVPALLGWHSTTVMTGSMQPRIMIGDVAVAKPAVPSDLTLGRVVLFDDPDHAGRLRLHRLVDVDAQGLLVTRGDANNADDSTHVAATAVRGVAVLRVPSLGLPIVWLREGQRQKSLVVGLALAGLLLLTGIDRDLVGRRGRREPAPSRARLAIAASLVLTAAVATPVVLVSPTAYAAYANANENPVSSLAAADYYRCSGALTADRPYLFYKFDETPTSGGTVTDSGTGSRNGVFQAGATSTTAACSSDTGKAVTLNGTSQYVSAGTSAAAIAAPTTYTLEAWFKTTAKQGKIIGFGNVRSGTASGSYDRHLYVNTAGQLVFGVYQGGYKTITSGVVTDGSWHHVVATMSSAGMILYVDGVQVAKDAAVTGSENNTGYWRVGWDNVSGWPSAPTSGYFSGSLDNVAVYTTALTPTQVAAHYAARS